MNIYHMPENEQKMDELYVVLSSDEKGEGIVSISSPLGQLPMVFGHKRMLDKTRMFAEEIAKETGKKLLIMKYKKSELLEEINP